MTQARASILFDVLNNIAADASLTNKNKSEENNLIAYDERTLALQHLKYCTKGDLVAMDRGYPIASKNFPQFGYLFLQLS